MNLTTDAFFAITTAVVAILMLGTTRISASLNFYTWHTLCLSVETFLIARMTGETHLYYIALVVLALKAFFVPLFLDLIIKRVGIQSDSATYLPPPICMHIGIILMGISYLITSNMPVITTSSGSIGATAAMSLIFTGMLLMLTRKVAISQIVGFLVIENGSFLFALTQTHGMPMMVEMGILLDVLVGVMITGLLVFNIKKNFEHIDVTQLTGLKE